MGTCREEREKGVQTIAGEIDALSGKTIDVYVRQVEKKQTRGVVGLDVPKFARGGQLPGYGGGDRIAALLEAGEFIIKKETVAKFGVGIFKMLNNMRIPKIPVPAFATGGLVGSSSVATYNLNLSFSGEVSQPSQTNAKQLARMVIGE
ncbi:hypothetical protein [Desulforhopalus singaporensis]|uniref:Uncharacterized protein n=1 Tax=Desulforhopalus singaporensis TaxID=91360 RepID=A0A1H0VH18_9BACT|nr:hypothetical protein [Desulforhopalus singaporensis]SDP77859.1 hypothetical protein SAMN05660330_04076 [Desulforhopalus singaporensis]